MLFSVLHFRKYFVIKVHQRNIQL